MDLYVPGDHPDVASAVEAAETGDVVHVAAGTFYQDGPIVVAEKSVTIVGDPAGTQIVASGGPQAAPAVFLVHPGSALTVESLSLDAGGLRGFQVTAADLDAWDVSVANGDTDGFGGALAATGSVVSWTGGAFSSNSAGVAGGHVYADGSTLLLDDLTFVGGTAPDGAVLYAAASDVTVDDLLVTAVHAASGSVFRAGGGTLDVKGSVFDGCSAGSAILHAYQTDPWIESTTFLHGASEFATVSLEGCPWAVFAGNFLCDNDAGDRLVKFYGSDGEFRNNVVRLDRAASYGIEAYGGADVHAANNTIVGTSSSGGAALVTQYGSTITAVNNVVAYTEGIYAGALWAASGPIGITYSLLYENVPGHASGVPIQGEGMLLDVDPGFPAPAEGSCTLRDLVPEPGSPLIDAGDPAILDADGTRSDLGATGGENPIQIVDWDDADDDGWTEDVDCDDDLPDVNPAAVERPCTGVDEDCTPATPDLPDADGDGVSACDDCDDTDPAATAEVEAYPDGDGDGFGAGSPVTTCGDAPDTSPVAGDCDDTDGTAFPGAADPVDDGIDQDCDGVEPRTTLGGVAGVPCGCRAGTPGPVVGLALAFALARSRSRRAR